MPRQIDSVDEALKACESAGLVDRICLEIYRASLPDADRQIRDFVAEGLSEQAAHTKQQRNARFYDKHVLGTLRYLIREGYLEVGG